MIDKNKAFRLFDQMILEATNELIYFTTHTEINTEHKADKSVVTECDKQIEKKLLKIAQARNLQIIGEEGEKNLDIVKSGTYLTIDPIDGTLGYIEYVNNAIETGDINNFLKEDLGPASDFCLLLGLVQNGIPTYGACYNFITKEKILIDGSNPQNLIRENNIRNYSQQNAVYLDQRTDGFTEKEILPLPNINLIKQAALGLKSLYTVINPHESAITVHKVQTSGLWDIMPAAVACRAFGGQIYDGLGEVLKFNEYIILPGIGATIVKGNYFDFILEKLKSSVQPTL